jgi:hypothetical protein
LFFFQFAFLLILDNTAAMRALLEARGCAFLLCSESSSDVSAHR